MNEERTLTVGQYLRQERERKNISLEAVAKVTRITLGNLEALERDDFRAISAPIFVRGFLRTYASHLGLDPKEVTARYESQIDLLQIRPTMKEPLPEKPENPLFKYLAVLFLIVIGVAIGFYFLQRAPAPTPQPPPFAAIPSPPKPVVQPPLSPSPRPLEKASPKPTLQLEKEKKQPGGLLASAQIPKEGEKPKEGRPILNVLASEKTWLRIKPDDQPAIEVLLQPKETASWSTRRQFDIIVGNAGGVEIFLNGVSQGRLGKSGEVIHLVLPKEAKASEPAVLKETKPPEPAPKEPKPSKGLPSKEPKPAAEEKKP